MEAGKNPSVNIREAIARAIVFFDLLDYPLTSTEIWKYIFQNNASLADVVEELDMMKAENRIEVSNGFYFFPGRIGLVSSRMESISLADGKFGIAIRTAKWLRFVPGVRLVAVCNSLAMGNVHEQSDIDFFIITAKNRIWLTRMLVTGVVEMLGVRRNKKQINDRVCLSFYVSEDKMDLEPVSLDKDPYFYYWIATLVPIYDKGILSRFIDANSWVKRYLPNHSPAVLYQNRTIKSNFFSVIVSWSDSIWFDSFVGAFFDRLARWVQMKKMSNNAGSLARENDTRVIISDTMLKFHENDRREEYRDRWIKKINEISK